MKIIVRWKKRSIAENELFVWMTNSIDSDQMLHDAVTDYGWHCFKCLKI